MKKNVYASVSPPIQSLLPLTNECGIVIRVLAVEMKAAQQDIQLGQCSGVAGSGKLLAQDACFLMSLYALNEFLEAYRTAAIGIYHVGVASRP